MGLESRHADARYPGRHDLHRVLHEQPHRGSCAWPPVSSPANRSSQGMRAMVVPGSMRVKAQAEAEGLDRIFRDAGFEWRAAGMLDVPRHESGSTCAGRTLRLDQQSQFRGSAGQGRAHASGLAGSGRGNRDRRHVRDAGGCGVSHEGSANNYRRRRAARSQRRRHGSNHPGFVPEAGRADRVRRGPLRLLAPERSRFRAQQAGVRRARRSSSPVPISAPVRPASTRSGR